MWGCLCVWFLPLSPLTVKPELMSFGGGGVSSTRLCQPLGGRVAAGRPFLEPPFLRLYNGIKGCFEGCVRQCRTAAHPLLHRPMWGAPCPITARFSLLPRWGRWQGRGVGNGVPGLADDLDILSWIHGKLGDRENCS